MQNSNVKSVQMINYDKRISLLVAALWGYAVLIVFVNTFVNLFTPNTPIDTIICLGIMFIVIADAIRPIVRRLKVSDIVFFLITFLTFLLSMSLFPDNIEMILGIIPRFFLMVFPYYLVGRAILDFEIVMKYLRPMSMWVILAALGCNLIIIFSGGTLISDNMSFSYMVLPSVLFMTYTSLEVGGIKNWLLVVLGLIVMLTAGTRGPIVCLFFFFVLYLVLNFKSIKVILKYIPLFLIGAFVVFCNIFITMLDWLNIKLMKINISNRIIQQLLQNELDNSSGRDILLDMVIVGIKEHPLLGNGIMGDRLLTQGFIYSVGGSYAHNLLFELWSQFGIVFGSVLVVALFVIVFGRLIKEKDRHAKYFITILISLGIMKLFMSGSYLFEPYLFLLIGVCVRNRQSHSSKKMRFSLIPPEPLLPIKNHGVQIS